VRRVPFQLPKAEVDAAVEEAVPPPPDREGDAATSRFGRDGPASAGAEGEDRQQEEGEAAAGTGTTGDERPGGASGFGERRSSTAEGRDASGAPARPSLRLSQVQVVVQNARGESFTLTTLHVERAR
jgi:hypothetical protein